MRIINEPTAAALAFGMTQTIQGQTNVLIFDLGGGTFDVSILNLDDGNFCVKSTNGDTNLGGEDFDNRLVDYCVESFNESCGIDITGKQGPIQRLKT